MKKKVSDILDNPILYSAFQKAVKTKRYYDNLDHLLGSEGNIKVLDYGCGPGDLLERLRFNYYLGIDPSGDCIRRAIRRFPKLESNARFCVGDQELLRSLPKEDFDLVIAIGVLHHMTDESVNDFLQEAYRILRVDGRLITLDPVRHEKESRLSGFLVKQDRGRNVRNALSYRELVDKRKFLVESQVHVGMLRIPYDQFSMRCRKLN